MTQPQHKLKIWIADGSKPFTLYVDHDMFIENIGGFSFSLNPAIEMSKGHIIKDFCEHCNILFEGGQNNKNVQYPYITMEGKKVLYTSSDSDT